MTEAGDSERAADGAGEDGAEHLFVYGTLRAAVGGEAHRRLADGARLVGEGWIAGRLYDTGPYPAAVSPDDAPLSDGGGRVRGEVWAVEAGRESALLAALDAYEGYLPGAPGASLFVRRRARVHLDDGGAVDAWSYFFARPTTGLPVVPDGDYPRWLARNQP